MVHENFWPGLPWFQILGPPLNIVYFEIKPFNSDITNNRSYELNV
jgi:hypothetical protein